MTETKGRKYPHPDLTILREMAEGDDAFFKEMITLFLENAPQMLAEIRESVSKGDCEKLKFAAHKILSDLSIVGINKAIPDVEIIERQASLKNIPVINAERAIDIINSGIEDLKKLV